MSLFFFLYRCIRNDILSGDLPANYRLPSKRSLAAHHGISVITVENAYNQLMAEGFIYSIPKSGYYVSEITPYAHDTWSSASYEVTSYRSPAWDAELFRQTARKGPANHNRRTEQAIVTARNAVREQSSNHTAAKKDNKNYNPYTTGNINTQPGGFIDFTGIRTDSNDYPFKSVRKIVNGLSFKEQEMLVEKCPPEGMTDFRKAIAHHLREFRGLSVSHEQIIAGAGAEYLYGLIIQLLGRDRLYGIEDPGYKKIKEIYRAHGAECQSIGMDEHGICMPWLHESGAEVIHISPSHHFPTGIVTPIGRRHELLAWANEAEGRYIIEDDYDSELRHSGMPIPALMSIDTTERVIYFNTFSKTIASSRLGYMVLPMHLLERFRQDLSFYSCTVSNLEQYIITRLMDSDAFERHIHALENRYNNVRKAIIKTVKESPLSEYADIINSDAGMHLLLKLDTNKSDNEIKAFAMSKGIMINFLSDYYEYYNNGMYGFVVINYTGRSSRSEKDMNDILRLTDVLYEAVTE